MCLERMFGSSRTEGARLFLRGSENFSVGGWWGGFGVRSDILPGFFSGCLERWIGR